MANTIIVLLILTLLRFSSTNPNDSPSSSVSIHYHDHEFKSNLNRRILQAGDPIPTSSTRDPITSYNLKRRSIPLLVLLALAVVIILLLLYLIYIVTTRLSRRRRGQVDDEELQVREDLGNDILQSGQLNKCQKFNFAAISEATDNFSSILGQGGFGPVYKGTLKIDKQTQTVAVKRLSSTSNQGKLEFWNEVKWITGLQHKNIVKLLGYCFEGGDQKLLIYEFMTNKSLNTLLSDKTNRLAWKTRMSILKGIAQGLVYLHEDSGLKIIHLDIKPSNILLDHEMNPKISDFGTAKQIGDNQSEANPKRIVGTPGYMAPECRSGDLSPKSDVYSFGVVLLEIISAPENCDHCLGIPVHTWELWRDEKPLELMDKQMALSSADADVVKRCIQIGLLCVQENAEDRPCMSSVLRMLENENIALSEPNKPPFASDHPCCIVM